MTGNNITLLGELAAEINKANDEAANAIKSAAGFLGDALGHGMRAGQLLIEAKAQHRHGNWGNWMSENLTFSERMAQTYMQLARNRGELERKAQQGVAVLNLHQAIRLIAAPKPDDGRSAKPKTQPVQQQVGELLTTWKESGAEGRKAFREWIAEPTEAPAERVVEQPIEINFNDATAVPTDNILEQMFGPLTGAEWSEMADTCSYRTGRGKNRRRIVCEQFMKLCTFHGVPLAELEAVE